MGSVWAISVWRLWATNTRALGCKLAAWLSGPECGKLWDSCHLFVGVWVGEAVKKVKTAVVKKIWYVGICYLLIYLFLSRRVLRFPMKDLSFVVLCGLWIVA